MTRTLSALALALGLAGVLCLPSATWGQEQPAPEQATPPVPSERGDLQPGELEVIYADGELTVRANHVPLSQVLRQVSAQIGATLDFSPGADEPIVATLGPGPAKKVIASLLEWAPYDYVIARSDEHPELVTSLLVFPKTPNSAVSNSRVPLAQVSQVQPKQVAAPASDNTIAQRSGANPLADVIAAAKDELARSVASSSAPLNLGGDPGDGSGESSAQINMDDVLKAVEAGLDAAAAAAPQQPADSVSAGVPSAMPRPPGRRRR